MWWELWASSADRHQLFSPAGWIFHFGPVNLDLRTLFCALTGRCVSGYTQFANLGDVKDVTATSFGLIMAYLLPGLAGFYAFTFYLNRVSILFSKFGSSESNVGLFLLVILASVIVGLQISVIRWVVFEGCLCRNHKLKQEDLAHLANKDKYVAFRMLVDEQYRYHQFFGGMAIVQPYLFFGWLRSAPKTDVRGLVAFAGLAIALETLTIFAAISAWKRYIVRGSAILKGPPDAQRIPQEASSQESRTEESSNEEDSEEGTS